MIALLIVSGIIYYSLGLALAIKVLTHEYYYFWEAVGMILLVLFLWFPIAVITGWHDVWTNKK